MRLHPVPQSVALGVVLLAMAACSGGAAIPPTTTLIPFETATPEGLPTLAQGQSSDPAQVATNVLADPLRGPCDHLLWPLLPGASWVYSVSSPAGSETLTLSVADNGGLIVFTSGRASTTLSCVDGLIGMLPPAALGLHPVFESLSIHRAISGAYLTDPGSLLPLGAAAVWDYEVLVSGALNDLGGTLNPESSRLIMQSQTAGTESISNNLGSFEALLIRQTWLLELNTTAVDGSPATLLGIQQSRLYLAEGWGPLRYIIDTAQINSNAGAVTLPTPVTLELIEFRQP